MTQGRTSNIGKVNLVATMLAAFDKHQGKCGPAVVVYGDTRERAVITLREHQCIYQDPRIRIFSSDDSDVVLGCHPSLIIRAEPVLRYESRGYEALRRLESPPYTMVVSAWAYGPATISTITN